MNSQMTGETGETIKNRSSPKNLQTGNMGFRNPDLPRFTYQNQVILEKGDQGKIAHLLQETEDQLETFDGLKNHKNDLCDATLA